MLDAAAVRVVRELTRSFDAAELNRIINDPSCLPANSPIGEKIDISPLLADTNNVYLAVEGGALLFVMDEPTIYNMHPNFLPGFRGDYALEATRKGIAWMFTHTLAMRLTGRLPTNNKHIRKFFERIGFKVEFTRKSFWPTKNKGNVDMDFAAMAYGQWCRSKELEEAGQKFCAQLNEGGAKLPDDQCLHGALGCLLETIYGGQPDKAVTLFNQWARFACYGQVVLVSHDPLVLDIGEAVLLIHDNNFKVLRCRSQLV